ncbi:Upstream activation factor subunit spp27, partial [Thalictrum thalictroides]
SKKRSKEVKTGGGGGFGKVSNLSPELQKVVGVPELPRTQVVRKLWAYIKEKNLQDPSNKKNIRCDESLRSIFRVDTINMFQMNKALSKHIWPMDRENAGPAVSTPRARKRKKEKLEDANDAQPKEKRHSGFLAPLPISEAMVKFIGTGERILPRSAVVKRIWDYIKENNLQDPSDKKTVICDDKLKELFEVDSFVGFTVPKLLKTHFIKELKEEQ